MIFNLKSIVTHGLNAVAPANKTLLGGEAVSSREKKENLNGTRHQLGGAVRPLS